MFWGRGGLRGRRTFSSHPPQGLWGPQRHDHSSGFLFPSRVPVEGSFAMGVSGASQGLAGGACSES